MGKRILVRHGQSRHNTGETNDYDPTLSERGELQILEAVLHVKEYMTGSNWVGFVSPYLRCLMTAQPMHSRFKIEMKVDSRIGEYLLPEDRKRTVRETMLCARPLNYPTYDWSEFVSESDYRSEEQYKADLKSFAASLPEDCIIVSHMTTIRNLTELLTDMNLSGREISNCSVTLIDDDELVFVGRR